MIEEFMSSRWGGYAVMAVMLGAIALLLRFLYGPRGILRDPRWNEESQCIRSEKNAEPQPLLRIFPFPPAGCCLSMNTAHFSGTTQRVSPATALKTHLSDSRKLTLSGFMPM